MKQIQIEMIPLKQLLPYHNNPRKNDGAVEYVKNSIMQFGLQVPLVVDKDNVIVCGHTRYKAAVKLTKLLPERVREALVSSIYLKKTTENAPEKEQIKKSK